MKKQNKYLSGCCILLASFISWMPEFISRKITFLIVLMISANCYSQSLCEGRAVIPSVTCDQCNSDPWVLVFEDNFNGNTLDLSKWEIQQWAQGALYGNGGSTQEYNTLDNAVVENGVLKIIAKKETIQKRAISWMSDDAILSDGLPNLRTYHFTSSNIWTKSKFNYGIFEARIKIPKGKGFWPAFWTYASNPWNEIDVFEFWNENNIWGDYDASKLSKVHHMTVHYDYDNDGESNQCSDSYGGVDFSQDFHVFTVIWEKDKIQWLVDGVVKRTDYRYYSILGQTVGCTIFKLREYLLNDIFPQDPMSIILNLAIQNGDDSPDNTTSFPSQMEVDWVRYYQRAPCQDVNITNANQYPIDEQVFNAIVGRDVSIDCDYIIQSGQQLEIIADNSIVLNSGFEVERGASFCAKVGSTVCDSRQGQEKNQNFFDTTSDEIPSIEGNILNKNVIISPNPNPGIFVIDFGTENTQHYDIVIVDAIGRFVNFKKKYILSTVIIDMSGNKKGLYFVYLFDRQNKKSTIHKISLL